MKEELNKAIELVARAYGVEEEDVEITYSVGLFGVEVRSKKPFSRKQYDDTYVNNESLVDCVAESVARAGEHRS